MSTEPSEAAQRAESDHDAEMALRVPALFVNRFRVRVGRDVVRVSFAEAESAHSEAHYRVAVIMPTGDALKLAASLRALAEKLQEQVQAATAAHDKPN